MIKIITLHTQTWIDLLLLKSRWPDSLSAINNSWNKTKSTACQDNTSVERGLAWGWTSTYQLWHYWHFELDNSLFGGLSCALSDIQQHPWPLPASISIACQLSPAGQDRPRLRTTGLNNSYCGPNSVSQLPLRPWLSHSTLWAHFTICKWVDWSK